MNSGPKAKTLAILAYLSSLLLFIHLLFFVAAFGAILIRNREIGSEFSTFHLRQMFGIGVLAVAVSVFESTIPNQWLALLLIGLMVLISLIGMTAASLNKKTELPLIGRQFQQWFKFIK
ncbi:MAG: hypothetical protein WBA16_11595 [Nonlabens sp.]